jgi:hypothetical protein
VVVAHTLAAARQSAMNTTSSRWRAQAATMGGNTARVVAAIFIQEHSQGKAFFFEKKKQKTFAHFPRHRSQTGKRGATRNG